MPIFTLILESSTEFNLFVIGEWHNCVYIEMYTIPDYSIWRERTKKSNLCVCDRRCMWEDTQLAASPIKARTGSADGSVLGTLTKGLVFEDDPR